MDRSQRAHAVAAVFEKAKAELDALLPTHKKKDEAMKAFARAEQSAMHAAFVGPVS